MSGIDYSKIEDIAVRAAQNAPMDRMKEVAKEAAKEAVVECASLWGFDVENPLEMQKDAAFTRSTRLKTEDTMATIYNMGLKGSILLFVAFLGSQVDKIGHHLR